MMTITTLPIHDFLKRTSPFDQLSPQVIGQLSLKCQPLRYRMGQAIMVRETMPEHIAILYEGQARLLGYAPQATVPETLQLLKGGEVLGWASLVRGVPCCAVIEVFELLGAELERRAIGAANLKELALKAWSQAVVRNLPPGKTPLHQLDRNCVWLVSGGAPTNFAIGSLVTPFENHTLKK